VDLSIRGRKESKINLGIETSKLANELGGFGGGHMKASGARIPAIKLREFIQKLSNLTK
jgi:nanoRNase/pAp phosphatase (c-di-AMP/oligoRNAs hydrolase)